MANDYTQFSLLIEAITDDERSWLEVQLDAATWMDPAQCAWDAHRARDAEALSFHWSFDKGAQQQLTLYAEECGDPENVIAFLQAFLRQFRPHETITFTWANWCSQPRPGAFSGGGAVIGAGGARILDIENWADEVCSTSALHLPRLTDAQIVAYVRGNGDSCPYCHSGKLTDQEDFDEATPYYTTHTLSCERCRRCWKNVRTLTGVIECDSDGDPLPALDHP